MAQRIDLDQEVEGQPLRLPHHDQPVENRLPVAVAREIVVGDEKPVHPLGDVGADQLLDIVGVAPARLPPLDVDDRAKAALERAAAPGIEGAEGLAVAPDDLDRQERGDLLLQPGQVVHVVVDRLHPAGQRVAEHLGEPAFGLAREQRDAHIPRRGDIGRQLGQHRQAAGDMKPADRHLHPGGAELPRELDRARELVRLHPDQADQPGIGRGDAAGDLLYRDDGVALVIGVDVDLDIGAEHPAGGDVLGQRIKAGERIRRDPRPHPLDDVAVVVVMRRLDQLDDKAALSHGRRVYLSHKGRESD